MTITAINGSPKGEKSNSREIISMIQSMLPPETEWNIISSIRHTEKIDAAVLEKYVSSDVLLIAFPLYVDSLPASLMQFLSLYEKGYRQFAKEGKQQRVFAVANCGFYEGQQNELALKVVEHFCESAGLAWCGGAGIGTGEMILGLKSVPGEAGIKKSVTHALRSIADAISSCDGRAAGNIYTQHNFPWILYKIAGEMGWRKMVKKNGLNRKQIDARPLLS